MIYNGMVYNSIVYNEDAGGVYHYNYYYYYNYKNVYYNYKECLNYFFCTSKNIGLHKVYSKNSYILYNNFAICQFCIPERPPNIIYISLLSGSDVGFGVLQGAIKTKITKKIKDFFPFD